MPKLDLRLQAVARQIRATTHADVGSDHGHLLAALLHSGRIARGIAIENKRQPFQNSCATLATLPAEVRMGDALAALQPGEADSLSICGIGGATMQRMLAVAPDRVPARIVLQPNNRPELVRRWALDAGFHLQHEQITGGGRSFLVMALRHVGGDDPAYVGVDRDAALLLGPLLLKTADDRFIRDLHDQRHYLRTLPRRTGQSEQRLQVIEQTLVQLDQRVGS